MTATVVLHFVLPADLFVALDRAARERHIRRSDLLRREAIESYVEAEGKAKIDAEMTQYATALAELSAKFVSDPVPPSMERRRV